ncbi:hypothetical protein HMPREF9148_00699 [Prevotella sp. F0091]|nr:hypothetical protein HMPREF9148_00699 [Prevotella sp. F0091]
MKERFIKSPSATSFAQRQKPYWFMPVVMQERLTLAQLWAMQSTTFLTMKKKTKKRLLGIVQKTIKNYQKGKRNE